MTNVDQIKLNDFTASLSAERDFIAPYSTSASKGLASAKATKQSYNLGKVFLDERRGVEWEVSCELSRKLPSFQSNGYHVPLTALSLSRDLNVINTDQLVGQNYTGPELLPVLRNKTVVLQAGARLIVPPISANLSLPRQDTTSAINWMQENNAITGSTFTLDSVPVNFHRASAEVYFSNQLLQQATISNSILDVVKSDLTEAMGVAIDLAALSGTGSSNNQPLGLLNLPVGSGLAQTQALTLSSPVAWGDVLQAQYLAETANIRDSDNTAAWITSPAVKKHLKSSPKVASASTLGFIWEANSDEISGQRAISTQQLAATNQLIYSPRWSELTVFIVSGISLLVDRYTAAQSNQTRVVCDALVGVVARHANAFVISTGAATN